MTKQVVEGRVGVVGRNPVLNPVRREAYTKVQALQIERTGPWGHIKQLTTVVCSSMEAHFPGLESRLCSAERTLDQ